MLAVLLLGKTNPLQSMDGAGVHILDGIPCVDTFAVRKLLTAPTNTALLLPTLYLARAPHTQTTCPHGSTGKQILSGCSRILTMLATL